MHDFAFPPTVASGWNPGQTGIGLNFDGSDDYINCENKASLDITDAITISAYLCRNGLQDDYSPILTKVGAGAGYDYYHLGVNGAAIKFKLYDGDNFVDITSSSIPNNTFVSIVGVRSNDGNAYIYIDGVEDKCVADTTGDIDTTGGTGVWIGADRNIANRYFNGSIDQPRIHNRALSAKEVMDYYINPWQVYLDEDD